MAGIDSDSWTGRNPDRAGARRSKRFLKLVFVFAPIVVAASLLQIVLVLRDGSDLIRLIGPVAYIVVALLSANHAREQLRGGESGK